MPSRLESVNAKRVARPSRKRPTIIPKGEQDAPQGIDEYHKHRAQSLRDFVWHLPAGFQESALETLDANTRSRLQNLLVNYNSSERERKDCNPLNWDDDRHDLASTLLRHAAMLYFAMLDYDTRTVLIRRAGILRQASPSVVADAVRLVFDVHSAIGATSVAYENSKARQKEGGEDAK